ncbi:MAG: transcription antitermination factor NusB [Microthrixaceae bacterium]
MIPAEPGTGGSGGRPTSRGSDEGVASRVAALEVLARVEDDDAFANLAVGAVLDRAALDERDRALATDLAYGAIRHRRALRYLVDRFLSDPPPPNVYRALELGVYQLLHRPDIPDYAAVSATVTAAPKRFRGLVNAVLRRVADADATYPDDATRLSYPDWMVDLLVSELGPKEALGALESMNEPARAHTRSDGYVQDPASQMVAELVAAELPGAAGVIDLCAAPGGKATMLAAGESTWVAAADVSAKRAGLIAANATTLGAADTCTVVSDATEPAFAPGSADAVLLDAPCSGLGVLRRRPDARWRITQEAPERLAALQRRMIDASVPLVAPGGLLAYSVCTLTAVETTGIDDYVSERHPGMQPIEPPAAPWVPHGRGAILLPQRESTDGMALFMYRSS